jgi:mRNA interferase MazF
MRRGEVWWVRFPAPVGRRPAVLFSRDQAYGVRGAITVVPITRTIRSIPVEVPLGSSDGIPKQSVANADEIVTVSKVRLENYLTTLAPAKMEQIERAIKFALDLT